MRGNKLSGVRRRVLRAALFAAAVFAALGAEALTTRAATWKGIEPLKSRRADVERALGAPGRESRADGALHFEVAGGRVTVFFVTPQTVASKKLAPELEGTVLQIVLQHERATDTPQSMGLDKGKRYERDQKGDVAVYTNAKDGVAYTFVGGRLTTTRFGAPAEQLARFLKKG